MLTAPTKQTSVKLVPSKYLWKSRFAPAAEATKIAIGTTNALMAFQAMLGP